MRPKDMLVISNKLTTGQITFILRVVIQILSYGGLFLIGLIILGNAPRVAPLETHDVLNRVVGKSTTTITSLKWITRRVFRRSRDPIPSSRLAIALALSLCYGLFVSLSDIGFIGFHSCTVAGSTYQDFPASVKTDSDALALISANMINGTDPHSIKSYRCDAAQPVVISVNVTERICSAWQNSTYGDPSGFRVLNSTDSDILMAKNLAHDNNTVANQLDLNTYFVGADGEPVTTPKIQGGIAVFPHDTGVRMITNVPQLTNQQRVDIPKTLILEADMGCLPLGTLGEIDPTSMFAEGKDFFAPDNIYNPKYTGPDILKAPLTKAAHAVRDIMLPIFNTSDVDINGYYRSINGSYGQFSWQTVVSSFFPPSTGNSTFTASDLTRYVMGNCTQEINQLLNVSSPTNKPPAQCVIYQLRGSFFADQSPIRGHAEMVCATTTQVNMASATIEADASGLLTLNITRLPSDLNFVQADYFEVIHDKPTPGDTTWGNYDPIYRYTLSDNPAGPLNHYIYQEFGFGGASSASFSHGAGVVGLAFSRVGDSMTGINSLGDATLGIIDPNYFSATNFSSAKVTQLGGAVGASFLLASVGYNGWAARGSQALTVVSTGGQLATCYNYRYAAAFLPLVLAAVFVLCWLFTMLVTSGIRHIRETGRLKDMYGGLAPTIVTPFAGKPPTDTVFVWENGPEPHLKPVINGMPIVGTQSDMLVSRVNNEIYSGYGIEK
ncbi:hypothetical protein GALMADRAFT_281662 [Galerina marginata CBS 339.88]|uniref:Uncharacterized protein n=1 Tax=Galerina marginata (strain CBS 339.88) TaxID=685588 RepID=A0A067SP57_GALM3|nr:hypothetical protein GALMADRAFT_281662 [Galerina marginata CBS 339.88]